MNGNIKRIIVFGVSFSLLLIVISQVFGKTETAYEMNLPIVNRLECPDVRIGGAWWFEIEPLNELHRMCMNWYYNTNPSFDYTGERIPMVACPTPHWYAIMNSLGADYTGYVLVGNEPTNEYGGCNLTDQQAANFLYTVIQRLPKAKIILGNFLSFPHMQLVMKRYLDTYGARPEVYAWGIHIYSFHEPELSVREKIERACNYLSTWYNPCHLWVTEVGVCLNEPNARDLARQYTIELKSNPSVETFAWFTNHWHHQQPCDLSLFNENGNISEIGVGVLQGLYANAERR